MYHPNPQFEFPSEKSSLDQVPVDSGFRAVWQQMQQKKTGHVRGMDFDGGQPATFYFARIPATGGHFVLVQFASIPPEGLDLSKGQ